MERNPAIYISLVGAFLTLLSVSGMALTEGKIQAIMGLTTIVIPILIGVITRSQVYSPESAQTALNMPQGSSLTLLNRALAADIPVFPSDTKDDVKKKVETAERSA